MEDLLDPSRRRAGTQSAKTSHEAGVRRRESNPTTLGRRLSALNMPQRYQSGEEVRIGDRVRCADDEGRIVALQEDLPGWGVPAEQAVGKAMIDFARMKLVCECTASNEDLVLISRVDP